MIEQEFLISTCHLNLGEKQCRYLSKIEGKNEYVCLKNTKNKKIIDNMVKETKKSNMPIGDNCHGLAGST